MDKKLQTIGERLQALRNANNLKVTDVQEVTGISVGNLSSMENDKTAPSSKALIKLSSLYGVTTDWILKGDIDGEETDRVNLNIIVPNLQLATYFSKIVEIWEEGDENKKVWVKVQLERAFPEIEEK